MMEGKKQQNINSQGMMKCVKVLAPKTLQVSHQKIPKPASGQVLIKVMAAPINPSDLELYNGNYGHQKKLPTIWGFQGSGVVVQNGGGMLGWSMVGKRVAFAVEKEGIGSYGQYSIAKVDQCLPLTEDTTFEEGSMSLVNPLTAISMLDIIKGKKQKSVLITAAASALGRMMNRVFPKHGIEVINVVRRAEQVEILQSQGASFILNSSDENFEEQLRDITEKLETRTCFEAIGGKMSGLILKNMPKRSTVTVYGCLSHEPVQDIDVMDLLVNDKKLDSFLLPNYLDSQYKVKLLPMFYRVRKLISNSMKSKIARKFPLDDAEKALDYYLKNMSQGKVIFEPWKEQQQNK